VERNKDTLEKRRRIKIKKIIDREKTRVSSSKKRSRSKQKVDCLAVALTINLEKGSPQKSTISQKTPDW